ncbi:hypothetical protein OHT59_33110 [Streptomyces sp. NBC_00243]|uniref:hypothetical protein n=1 Tax=Streptomyces sp. NBC_00243 TaxID=2975688 RepID=UPI002DDB660A|nr:hypothetical protein [Streptomyces sp. NBC_00243]WRZ22980.1 hypothetical protein OHT59_33110 [Streptomyces sp. NBC_00243]
MTLDPVWRDGVWAAAMKAGEDTVIARVSGKCVHFVRNTGNVLLARATKDGVFHGPGDLHDAPHTLFAAAEGGFPVSRRTD